MKVTERKTNPNPSPYPQWSLHPHGGGGDTLYRLWEGYLNKVIIIFNY